MSFPALPLENRPIEIGEEHYLWLELPLAWPKLTQYKMIFKLSVIIILLLKIALFICTILYWTLHGGGESIISGWLDDMFAFEVTLWSLGAPPLLAVWCLLCCMDTYDAILKLSFVFLWASMIGEFIMLLKGNSIACGTYRQPNVQECETSFYPVYWVLWADFIYDMIFMGIIGSFTQFEYFE